MLQEWLELQEFSQVLAKCGDERIEVLWKTNRQVINSDHGN